MSTLSKRILTSVVLIAVIGILTYFISWSTFPPNGNNDFITASYIIVFSIATIAYGIIGFEVISVVLKKQKKSTKIVMWLLFCVYGWYIIWRYFSITQGLPSISNTGSDRIAILGLSSEQLLATVAFGAILFLFSFQLGLKNILVLIFLAIVTSLFVKNTSWISTRIGWETMFWIFLIAIFTDTFAYFIGSKYGKHKMFKEISPKKTWEGTVGGLVFGAFIAVVVGTIFSLFHAGGVPGNLSDMSIFQLGPLHFWAYFLIGIGLSIFTQIGDLFFSVIKRNYGVKDYSNIFPGHGGLLDRIDGTIFAILIFSLIYVIFSFPPFL